MDITGKIIFVSEPRSGKSKTSGNDWTAQDFVIETHEQYPRKCAFSVFGQDRLSQMHLEMNGEYTVSFDIDAHEYNGRWFNSIRAWRAVPAEPEATASNNAAPSSAFVEQSGTQVPVSSSRPAASSETQDQVDDLPF